MTPSGLSKLKLSLKMTILSLLMTSVLAGCGIRGTLKTPPPVFGGDSKVDPNRVPTDDLDEDDRNQEYDSIKDEDFGSPDEDPLADL